MSTCFDYHILLSLHTLTITCPLGCMPWCSYARTLLWLYALMFTSFVDHLLLCSLAMMIECFPVYMLWWSHACYLVCLQAHMLGHFDDYLLLYWNDLIIACSHALIFTCLISTQCAHILMTKCLLGQRLKWSCNRMFVYSNALMIVLDCWGD